MNLVSKACAGIWRLIDASPLLVSLREQVRKLVRKSIVLNHPFIQLERGFVFIHVPKTAGTAIRQALHIHAPLDIQAHKRAVEVLPYIKSTFPDMVSVAFVRNPFTRFVSLYNFARMDESLYHSTRNPAQAPYGKHPDHDLLLAKSIEECAELLIQGKLGFPCAFPSIWHPQVEWLIDREGKLIVDFIGRVESIDADLQHLKELYGLESDPVLRINESSDETGVPDFTPRACDLIRLYYKRDFEMLGYEEDYVAGPCRGTNRQLLDSNVRNAVEVLHRGGSVPVRSRHQAKVS